jgi:hypothetical protein
LEKAVEELNSKVMPIGAKMYEQAQKEDDTEKSDEPKEGDKKSDKDDPIEGEVVDDEDKGGE